MTSNLREHITSFINDRIARGLSRNTIAFYKLHLYHFADDIVSSNIIGITPSQIRTHIAELHRTPGGKHGAYRAIKAFLNWYWEEYEPGIPNPIRRVQIPAQPPHPIPGVTMDDIHKLLAVCDGPSGARDKAMFLLLLDSGIRASELAGLDVGDVDLPLGIIHIRNGKGGYPRTVFIGDKTRRAIRKYLKDRGEAVPLIASVHGTRLDRFSLRLIINRRSKQAGITSPGLHDFRRCFAITMLRNGVDILTISRLLGHHSVAVTQRYLAQTGEDLIATYKRGSPVDNADW